MSFAVAQDNQPEVRIWGLAYSKPKRLWTGQTGTCGLHAARDQTPNGGRRALLLRKFTRLTRRLPISGGSVFRATAPASNDAFDLVFEGRA
jgi:hypothetical protein